jgi:hypothetical protein
MTDDHPQAGAAELDSLERLVSDDCVEYMLFVFDDGSNIRKQIQELENIRKAASQFVQTLAKDYIWQKDDFNLEVKVESGMKLCDKSIFQVTWC